MAGISGKSVHFSRRMEQGKGIAYHWILELKGERKNPLGSGGHLRSREAVTELRDVFLPDFMKRAGLKDLTENGFRLALDIRQPDSPVIHLMAGTSVAPQNPHDWLSKSLERWDPAAPAPFFEKCAEAARKGEETMAFGNQMLYAEGSRGIFGVLDGDPKSETHFLVLAAQTFGTIMDKGFTVNHLNRFFETAFQICQQLGILEQHTRFVINTGTGFQVGPRVHMHVLSAKTGLPSMFPVDYGFEVSGDGMILQPAGSAKHGEVIDVIKARQQIEGFSPAAKAARLDKNALLLQKLAAVDMR